MENKHRGESLNPFSGLRAAVTGGTSGLGLALVQELLARGAQVAFVARGRDRVERVARENHGAHGIVGDVSLKADIHPLALQIAGGTGRPRRIDQQCLGSRADAVGASGGYRM